MLYDNALLLRVYTQLWRLTGDRLALRVATETADFLFRDLFDGAFVSSLDADTGGVEGATYAWTPEQLRQVLGEEDGAFAADLLAVTDRGSFEHGTSVLRLARDIDDADDTVRQRWAGLRRRLLEARGVRAQPARDDKVVAAWNGLAITALAEFALAVLGNTHHADDSVHHDAPGRDVHEAAVRSAEHARAAGELLAQVHLVDGRLRRASRGGVVGLPDGVLDDYGCVAEAFCALHQLTGEGRWLDRAGGLLDSALVHFTDGGAGFHDTADDAERLVARPADPTDNATPSGLSSLAAALVSYTALSGNPAYREAAERALETVTALMVRHPRYAGYSSAVAEAMVSGPYEIAIVEPTGTSDLAGLARRYAPPGAVIVTGRSDQPGVPLLAGRSAIDGLPTAYVCRGFVCDRPVTTAVDLTALLTRSAHRP